MKTLFFLIFISHGLFLFSQKTCYIAVSSNDCSICLTSYKFINKIDRSLNPVLVFSKADTSVLHYFVNDYLKISGMPILVDEQKFRELTINRFDHQVRLYDDTSLLFEIPVKDLSFRLNDLNAFASPVYGTGDSFTTQNLDNINAIIQKKFFGATDAFIIREYLALYSGLTKWIISSNLKTGLIHSLQLSDSILFSYIFTEKQLTEINHKRTLLQAKLGDVQIEETSISSFCYYDNHLYLRFSALDYYNLKDLEKIMANEEIRLSYKSYLLELTIENSNFVKGRLLKLSEDDYYKDILFLEFCMLENQPAMLNKKTESGKDTYEYVLLNNNWLRQPFIPKHPELISFYLLQNLFFNQYIHNYEQHLLVNNNTGESLKIYPGTFEMNTWSCVMFPYGESVYFNVLNRNISSHELLKADFPDKSVKKLKTYKEPDAYSFYPIFYHEELKNKLHILDINDNKQLFIVNTIRL